MLCALAALILLNGTELFRTLAPRARTEHELQGIQTYGSQSLAWDSSGKRLALLNDAQETSGQIVIWPSNKRIRVNGLGESPYIRWSGDDQTLVAGGGSRACEMNATTGKIVRWFKHTIDLDWFHNHWRALRGEWPELEFLPGMTGSTTIKRVGTRLPLALDSGAGSAFIRIADGAYRFEYLPHGKRHHYFPFGPDTFEVDGRPFCVRDGASVLVGVPLRVVEGFELWQYRDGKMNRFSFDGFSRAKRVNQHRARMTLLSAAPIWICGHLIAPGFRMAEDVNFTSDNSSFFIDFTKREMRSAPDQMNDMVASSKAARVAAAWRSISKVSIMRIEPPVVTTGEKGPSK